MARARYICFFILFTSILPSMFNMAADPLNGAELVKEVCNHTSNYTFCMETLDTDPKQQVVRASELVNTALRFAQAKATHAQSLIALLLNNATAGADRSRLQNCQSSYSKAVSELSSANNDFNSDTIDTMVEEMNGAAEVTQICQNEIQASHFSALANINVELIKLCEICVVSTKYYSSEDFY